MSEITIHYQGPVVTRAEARAKGLRHYFTGRPCKYGHLEQKQTSTGNCMACKRNFENQWRVSNPSEAKNKSKLRYHRNRKSILEAQRLDRINNSQKYKNKYLKRRDKNYIYGLKNRERMRENTKRWRQNNPQGYLSHIHKRRSALARGTSFTQSEIDSMLINQSYRCLNCRRDISNNPHIDHVMPLSLGGDNSIKNIQLLCQTCNQRKHAKHPIDWALENGRLV